MYKNTPTNNANKKTTHNTRLQKNYINEITKSPLKSVTTLTHI